MKGGSRDVLGVGMYLLAALLFAVNGVISKQALEAGLDPQHWTAIRSAGAAVVLGIALLVWRPRTLRIQRRELGFLIAYGVIAFALVQWLYFVTITRLPVGFGTLLVFLAPVVTAVYLRAFRGVRAGARLWLAIALAVGGLALVSQFWAGLSFDVIGIVAGLACAVSLASYWLLGERGQEHRDPISLTFWGFVFATILWSVLVPWWTIPWGVVGGDALPIDGLGGLVLPVWIIAVWNVLLGTIAPFLLVLASLRILGAQRAGIVGTSEPIFAAVLAAALIGEAVSPIQGIGGLIVIGGIVLAETARRPSREVSESVGSLPIPG